MKKVIIRKTDPKKNSDGKFVKKVTKMYIDGIDVANLPGGYIGRTIDQKSVNNVGSLPSRKKSSGPNNPGATMKAIKSTKGKAKSTKVSTSYKSTGSNMGKATPMKKRKRGA